MPNWVYTTMEVRGKSEDIKKFLEKASTPYTAFHKGVRTYNEDGTTSYDADAIKEEVQQEKFMFWNFVTPSEDEVAGYWSKNWYEWNIANWGVKWDCSNSDYYSEPDYTQEKTSVGIGFETAWSIPEGAFRAIINQHPELDFDFECEEEQGWGATYTSGDYEEGEERSLIETESWDIPDCHADYVKRGRDCWACDSGDEDDYYDDCPRPERDFYVVVTKTYRVKAASAENAWNLAIENEDNLDDLAVVMEDETSTWIKNEDGSRAYPNFDTDEDEDGSL